MFFYSFLAKLSLHGISYLLLAHLRIHRPCVFRQFDRNYQYLNDLSLRESLHMLKSVSLILILQHVLFYLEILLYYLITQHFCKPHYLLPNGDETNLLEIPSIFYFLRVNLCPTSLFQGHLNLISYPKFF